MQKYFPYLLILIFSTFYSNNNWGQSKDLVEVTGKVFINGSDEPLGGVVVSVIGTERGVRTNGDGNFTIIMKRGQELLFETEGIKNQYYTLPNDVVGNYHTIQIPIEIDTIYLEEFVVRQMTPEEFAFAFKYNYVPDESMLASRNNMSPVAQAIIIGTMQRNGVENQSMQQKNNYLKYGSNYGQQDMSNLGNPYAWKEFIDSWKKGDFKGKKKK